MSERILCAEDPIWDWWLKLPPAVKGAAVKEFHKCYGEVLDTEAVKQAMADAAIYELYPAYVVNYKMGLTSA